MADGLARELKSVARGLTGVGRAGSWRAISFWTVDWIRLDIYSLSVWPPREMLSVVKEKSCISWLLISLILLSKILYVSLGPVEYERFTNTSILPIAAGLGLV